jgi:hypothetical protein
MDCHHLKHTRNHLLNLNRHVQVGTLTVGANRSRAGRARRSSQAGGLLGASTIPFLAWLQDTITQAAAAFEAQQAAEAAAAAELQRPSKRRKMGEGGECANWVKCV